MTPAPSTSAKLTVKLATPFSSVSDVPCSGEIVPIVDDKDSSASPIGVTPSASVSLSATLKGERAEKLLVSSPSELTVSSVRTKFSRISIASIFMEASTVLPSAVKLATTDPAPSVPLKLSAKDATPFSSVTEAPLAGSISTNVVDKLTTSLSGTLPSLLVTVTLTISGCSEVT